MRDKVVQQVVLLAVDLHPHVLGRTRR
jgi:hypothetical protein